MASHAPALTHTTPPSLRRGPWHALLVRYWARLLVALAVAAVVAVGIARRWEAESLERRSIASMPTPERDELYAQLLRSTQMLCARASRTDETLVGRCADAASFLRTFPECDDTCRSLAPAHPRRPTR